MTRVIGLDASTTTIGIAILDYDGYNIPKLIHHEYYKPNKKLDLINKLLETRKYILDICKKYCIDEFVIEDYVRFMANKSSAATTIPLAILNITLRLNIFDNLSITPNSLNVMKIRHTLKLNKKLPSKEDIPELVSKHLNIEFPWEYKINKKTKEKQPKTECFDMADAIAVALAWIKIKSIPRKKK